MLNKNENGFDISYIDSCTYQLLINYWLMINTILIEVIVRDKKPRKWENLINSSSKRHVVFKNLTNGVGPKSIQ